MTSGSQMSVGWWEWLSGDVTQTHEQFVRVMVQSSQSKWGVAKGDVHTLQ